MMNDFYKILELQCIDNNIRAEIELNPNHAVYEGHFPNKPILPGVCMIYMAKQIIERALNLPILVEGMNSCKFLKMLDPHVHGKLQFSIDLGDEVEGRTKILVSGKCGDDEFIKVKGQIQLLG